MTVELKKKMASQNCSWQSMYKLWFLHSFFNFKLNFYQEISVVIDKCLVVTKALYFVEHHDVS